jgi:hypothetical protein
VDGPDDECSATKSAAKPEGCVFIASGSASEKPVASGWLSGGLSGGHKWIFVRKGGRRWFFTSLLLILLMWAPFVRLRNRKMLVWSWFWSAEGEKGETDCCVKHTLDGTCAPVAFN